MMTTHSFHIGKILHVASLALCLFATRLQGAPIPGLFNTGVDANGVVLADNSIDPHYALILNPDSASPNALVQNSQAFPIAGGPWLANNSSSKWIGPRFETAAAAGGNYTYRTTFDLTGLDPGSAVITGGWTSDNNGLDILINGISTGIQNTAGFGSLSSFTISSNFIAGVNTLDFAINNADPVAGYTGLRVELSGTAFPPGTPPTITSQPKGQCVAEGLAVSFSVIAQGSPAPTYQWRYDGTPMPAETNPTLSIASVASFDAGTYDVVVSNPSGSVTSSVAVLTVGLAMINPSFEADTFATFPGYVTQNGPITGWTSLGNHGINPGTTFSPFADNGAIPHGAKVAFMQGDGAMTQSVPGFTVGELYYVHYFENARGGNRPGLAVTITDGTNTTTLVAEHIVNSVGGSNPYREVTSSAFVATASEMTLACVKSNPAGGDTTVLIDNVCIVQIQPDTPPFITEQPGGAVVQVSEPFSLSVSAIGGLPLTYQWRKGGSNIAGATNATFSVAVAVEADEDNYTVVVANAFGSATSAVARVTIFEPILGLFNTGVDGEGDALPDGTVDPHYSLTVNPDGGSPNAIVQSSTEFPIVAGPWLANTATSKWIGPRLNTAASAAGNYTYRTTLDLTGRDPATVVILGGWATDNPGVDILVNGLSTTNAQSPGFGGYTAFALSSTNATFVAGTNTIDFVVNNVSAGYTGLRVQINQSNVKIPPGTPPAIARNPRPRDSKLAVGDSVSIATVASGSAPLTYQWWKDGVALAGQTNTTLNLTGLTTADSGNYTVVVSNAGGSVTSAVASVCICFTVVPGIYSTGVDGSGALLPDGAVDAHYRLTASADGAYPGPESYVVNTAWPIAPAGPWIANGPRSRWIAPRADQDQISNPAFGNAPGNYTFQTEFDLFDVDLSVFFLQGRWAVDNSGTDILVNGAPAGITSPGFGAFTAFNITNGIVTGLNTLAFVMNNSGTAISPAGLRVDLRGLLVIQPRLSIGRDAAPSGSASQLVVSWTPTCPGQQLQAASSLNGPTVNWQTVAGAASPLTINADQPMRFFRVKP